jgi:hypothetical protein
MKTALYLIFTCFVSAGAFYGALYSKHPIVLYMLGFGIWALFLWGCNRRSKKGAERRSREQLFQDYMRAQIRNFKR